VAGRLKAGCGHDWPPHKNGHSDTLRDEGEAYAPKLVDAGNVVQLRRYGDTIHGFFTMPGTLRVAREAVRDVAEFLRVHLALR